MFEEHIMEVRSIPPRIFSNNMILIPYDFTTAIGKEIIKKYKLKSYDYEKIEYLEELTTNKAKLHK